MTEINKTNHETFSSFRKRFVDHLNSTHDIVSLSKKFGALNSNSERVDFVLELLKSYNIEINFQNDSKNDDFSAELRNQGNKAFQLKKLQEAWELYTKSISFAQAGNNTLGLAYANRSAVLYELKLKEQCLMDISRALEHNYPEHLKEKLLTRQEKCKKIKSFEKPQHEPIPSISQNPQIESASDSLEIQEDEDFGRFVVAARDIRVGEVLAVEKPFASLIVDKFLSHCHECLTLCYNLIPCETCTQALYCSEDCKLSAFRSYHRYECPILLTLRSLQFQKLEIIPLKIAFLTKDLYNNNLDISSSEVYKSDRYKEIHNLITNSDKRSISDLFARSVAPAVLFNLVKSKTNFFDEAEEKLEQKFKDILLLHMQTGPSNFHEITELAPTIDGTYEPHEFACGAFAFLSLVNHSCSPNVTRFCYGSTIVMRAIQDIKKGQQCFDNYGYHYALMNKIDRKKNLEFQYYFSCTCEACTNNWPLYCDLPNLGRFEVEKSMMSKLSAGDVDFAKSVLEDFLAKFSSLQVLQPCKDFSNIQEVIKQCYATFGNKRKLF